MNLPPPDTSVLERIDVQHGMLAFKSKQEFISAAKMLNQMTYQERKKWEESITFKSYDRLIHEIIDSDIQLYNKYDNLDANSSNFLKDNKKEEHSNLVMQYVQKGIIYFKNEMDGSTSMDYVYLPFSKLINSDGFVKIANNIVQYSKDKFKVIKNGDFNKIDQVKKIEQSIDNDQYYISDIDIVKREKIIRDGDDPPGGGSGDGYPPPPLALYSYSWSGLWRESPVEDRKRIILAESWVQNNFGDGTFITEYGVTAKTQKKNFWGNWVAQDSRIWLDGHGQIVDGDTNPDPTINIDDYKGSILSVAVYQSILPEGQYPNYTFVPYAGYSYWKATRWGGAHGIKVEVLNHQLQ